MYEKYLRVALRKLVVSKGLLLHNSKLQKNRTVVTPLLGCHVAKLQLPWPNTTTNATWNIHVSAEWLP